MCSTLTKSYLLFLIVCFFIFNEKIYAQNIGIGTLTPDISAKLDIVDANRGILIPRIAIANLNAAAPVTTPATSLLVYNTNTTTGIGFYYWNGSQWIKVLDGNDTDHDWYETGATNAPNSINDNIYTQGNVGIGVTSPTSKLEIDGGNILTPWEVLKGGGGIHENIGLRLWDQGTDANNINIIEFGHNSPSYVAGARLRSTNPNLNATTGAKLILETTSDNANTWNSNQLVLSNNGNVGIGTTTPSGRLTVEANADLIDLKSASTASHVRHYLGGNQVMYQSLNSIDSAYVFRNLKGFNANILAVNFESERVGVGITKPLGSFHVYNTIPYNTNDSSVDNSSIVLYGSHSNAVGSHFGGITWASSPNRKRAGISSVQEELDADYVGLAFWTQGTDGPGPMYESMRISSRGNIGIGTTAPQGRLQVRTNDTEATLIIDNSIAANSYGGRISSFGNTNKGLKFETKFNSTYSEAMVIDNNNNIGIGTSAPSTKFEVKDGGILKTVSTDINHSIGFRNEVSNKGWNVYHLGSTDLTPNGFLLEYFDGIAYRRRLTLDQNGNMGLGTTAPSEKLEVCGNAKIVGQIQANSSNLTAGLTCSSDKRLKKNIIHYSNALVTIQLLKGKQYYWRSQKFTDRGFDERIKYGFIAQEVEKVLPSLVYEDKKGFKSVDYIQVIPILTNAIQEQQDLIIKQQEQLDNSNFENQELRAELQTLKSEVAKIQAILEIKAQK